MRVEEHESPFVSNRFDVTRCRHHGEVALMIACSAPPSRELSRRCWSDVSCVDGCRSRCSDAREPVPAMSISVKAATRLFVTVNRVVRNHAAGADACPLHVADDRFSAPWRPRVHTVLGAEERELLVDRERPRGRLGVEPGADLNGVTGGRSGHRRLNRRRALQRGTEQDRRPQPMWPPGLEPAALLRAAATRRPAAEFVPSLFASRSPLSRDEPGTFLFVNQVRPRSKKPGKSGRNRPHWPSRRRGHAPWPHGCAEV